MELQKQVVSLDLAKRLTKLGVKQESLFYWHWMKKEHTYEGWTYQDDVKWQLLRGDERELSTGKDKWLEVVSAFTVAELGELLPDDLNKGGWENWDNVIECVRNGKHHIVRYRAGDAMATAQSGITEADARAKMLIYLLENNLIPTP